MLLTVILSSCEGVETHFLFLHLAQHCSHIVQQTHDCLLVGIQRIKVTINRIFNATIG